jgi:hypothetical protein
MPDESSVPEEGEVDVVDFDDLLAKGEVGGDVVEPEGGVIAVIDGVEIRNITDTRAIVADVEDQGLDDFPGGEHV